MIITITAKTGKGSKSTKKEIREIAKLMLEEFRKPHSMKKLI